MSRTIRLVMLVWVSSVPGACSESPTGPTAPATSVTKPAPQKANPDGYCDWINPWTRC
jgi:hypothetical protein